MKKNIKAKEGDVENVEKEGSVENVGAQAGPNKMRRIIIETDGTSISLVSADVAGKLELIAIFENLLSFVRNNKS